MTEKLKLVSESEAKLRKIHQQLWDIVNEHLGPEDPNAVMMLSGAMLKVCLELYTVVLQDSDIENLLDVFSKLTIVNNNLILLLVGKDEMNIRKLINDKKLNKRIKIFPHSNKIVKFFQITDIFCLPSEREGFGLSLIEASSCEIPVVCSDIYGIGDTMINNITGFKYNLKNQKKFLNILNLLIHNPKLRFKLGRRGRNFVKSKYERKKVLMEFLNYFNHLLSKK